MLTNIRQGIISGRTVLTAPVFLQKNGSVVDLICSPGEPTLITFAHKGSNYLIEETVTVSGAWGTGIDSDTDPDIINNPLDIDSSTKYLYWDISLRTGRVTYGWTDQSPYISGTVPASPINDTHWFDVNNTTMKVFRKASPSSTGKWIDKIRVFAGTWTPGGGPVLSPMSVPNLPPPGFFGSQVGLTGEFQSGTIIFGVDEKPIKAGDGTFLTTATPLVINKTGGQNVRFDATVTYGMASEAISAFSLITVQANKFIGLASSSTSSKLVNGIITEDLHENEIGYIVSNGYVRNSNWTWTSADVGKPLFCGLTGQVSLTPPSSGVSQQVGFVWDVDAIYVNIFAPVLLSATASTAAPIILSSSGQLSKATVGTILDNVDGLNSHTAFTLNGRGLLYSNGESTNGSVGISFQDVYNRDTEVTNGEATIVMSPSKHFTFRNPLDNATWFSIDADTGDVYFGGNIQIGGGFQLAEAIDHLVVSPNAASTIALLIEPDNGVTPTVDLFQIKNTFGGPNVLSISANGTLSTGNISVGGNIFITGTVDGVDVSNLSSIVSNHIAGSSSRHTAAQIDLAPIAELPSITNVQSAIASLAQDVASGFGSVVSAYEHVQNVPNITWIVNHNTANRKAQVMIWTLDWNVIIPDSINAIDDNNIAITFAVPQTGRAILTTLTPSSGTGGSGGGITDGNKGDITVSSSGTIWDINSSVIANSNLVNVSTSTIKGRISAGSGVVEDLTPSQARLILNVANGATANATDSQLRDRSTHTGVQVANTISDLAETIRDVTGATLIQGTGISIAVNDGADTITISSTVNGISDGSKGNITVSGSGSVWSINANTIENSAFSQIGTSIIKGRASVGTGNVEDLTSSQVRAILNVANGATANATDSQLRDRSTHTGTQLASTISDIDESVRNIVGTTLTNGEYISIDVNDIDDQITISAQIPIVLPFVVVDETTQLIIGSNKLKFIMPIRFTLTKIKVSLSASQPSGADLEIDILRDGETILSDPITIGNTELFKNATGSELIDTDILENSEMSVDILTVGDSGAAGLKIFFIGYINPNIPA